MVALRARADSEVDIEPRRVDIRRLVGHLALGVFVLAGTIAGFLFGIRWGFVALAFTSIVASYFLGAE